MQAKNCSFSRVCESFYRFDVFTIRFSFHLISYLICVHRQIMAAQFDVQNLYHNSPIDLKAPSPLLFITIRHVAELHTNVGERFKPLTKRWRVYGCKEEEEQREQRITISPDIPYSQPRPQGLSSCLSRIQW